MIDIFEIKKQILRRAATLTVPKSLTKTCVESDLTWKQLKGQKNLMEKLRALWEAGICVLRIYAEQLKIVKGYKEQAEVVVKVEDFWLETERRVLNK